MLNVNSTATIPPQANGYNAPLAMVMGGAYRANAKGMGQGAGRPPQSMAGGKSAVSLPPLHVVATFLQGIALQGQGAAAAGPMQIAQDAPPQPVMARPQA